VFAMVSGSLFLVALLQAALVVGAAEHNKTKKE
jgi:hypothetical protein